MKSLFYFGLLGLFLFEIAGVYFIMPMPGSQQMDTLALAYFLFRYRWFLRGIFAAMIAAGIVKTYRTSKWLPSILLVIVGFVTYFINTKMFAEAIFHQPKHLSFATAGATKLPPDAVVIAVSNGGVAQAFPIRYIAYHHQVQTNVGGKNLLITYCDVCRTGCVYQPVVDGKEESFRLVGMDHFNAMLEDKTTKSWWRQATGEAVTGELKGKQLPFFPSQQMSLAEFFTLYPNGLVMQADPDFVKRYDSEGSFEKGKDTDPLTRTDTASWKDKSWVVGIRSGQQSKAYDWNTLAQTRLINDTIGSTPIVLVLLTDAKSFFAFERPGGDEFALRNDSLVSASAAYPINSLPTGNQLKRLPANQVFWHTWRTFYPRSTRFGGQ